MANGIRRFRWHPLVVTALVALGLATAACGAPEVVGPAPPEEPAPAATGTVEIRATDAPPENVSSIGVTVSNIEVHRALATEDGWVTVVSEEKTFDLVEIAGAEVFLGEKEVEAGRYTEIRLDVTRVSVTADGQTYDARLPGDKLRVVRSWEVKAGERTILTLDFEAEKFVVITGAGQAQVKPVLKLEVTQSERPLKEKGEEAEAAPEKEAEAPEVSAPDVAHTTEGQDDCLACHSADGFKPFPADHAGRGNDACASCHATLQ